MKASRVQLRPSDHPDHDHKRELQIGQFLTRYVNEVNEEIAFTNPLFRIMNNHRVTRGLSRGDERLNDFRDMRFRCPESVNKNIL